MNKQTRALAHKALNEMLDWFDAESPNEDFDLELNWILMQDGDRVDEPRTLVVSYNAEIIVDALGNPFIEESFRRSQLFEYDGTQLRDDRTERDI